MDWAMDFLKDLTIDVEFRKNNEPLFYATTWPGYVGVLTGMRPGKFSVSVNFRVTGGSFLTNAIAALGAAWPTGFLVRSVLAEDRGFDVALASLSGSPLIAPTYFTVCGAKPREAALLTRDRRGEATRPSPGGTDLPSRWTMERHGPVIQTNADYWSTDPNDDILWSFDRIDTVRSELQRLVGRVTEVDLWRIMSIEPVLNELTVYGTIMCPATGLYKTHTPLPFFGFRKAEGRSDQATALGRAVRDANTKFRTCKTCMRPFQLGKNDGGECELLLVPLLMSRLLTLSLPQRSWVFFFFFFFGFVFLLHRVLLDNDRPQVRMLESGTKHSTTAPTRSSSVPWVWEEILAASTGAVASQPTSMAFVQRAKSIRSPTAESALVVILFSHQSRAPACRVQNPCKPSAQEMENVAAEVHPDQNQPWRPAEPDGQEKMASPPVQQGGEKSLRNEEANRSRSQK
jgi:hypothetical protein